MEHAMVTFEAMGSFFTIIIEARDSPVGNLFTGQDGELLLRCGSISWEPNGHQGPF
jgi:hypothetical protein